VAISVNAGMNRGRRSRGSAALSEINVTPFVDVALVLLIIFMITANVMEYGIEINVPKTKTVSSETVKSNPAVIQISKTGNIYLGKDPVDVNRVVDEIHAKYPGQKTVYVRADGETKWDPIAYVTSVLGEAHFAVSIVTRPDNGSGKKR